MKGVLIAILVHSLLLYEKGSSDDVSLTPATGDATLSGAATTTWDLAATPTVSSPPSDSPPALVCSTPLFSTPRPSETSQITKAKCRTYCLTQYFNTTMRNAFGQSGYPGTPAWLIVPDSYVCAASTGPNSTFYSQVWECINACINFPSSFSCSSICFANCTSTCTPSSACSDYYPPSTPCRRRTCSQTVCLQGCGASRSFASFGLPRQYSPVGTPQLIPASNQANIYRLNITSLAPKSSQSGSIFNLVVKVQLQALSLTYYYWMTTAEDLLDLSSFSCQNVTISIAVINYLYFVTYSNSLFFRVPPGKVPDSPSRVTSSEYVIATSLEAVPVTSSSPLAMTSSSPLAMTSSSPLAMTSSSPLDMTSSSPLAATSSLAVTPAATIAMATSDFIVTTGPGPSPSLSPSPPFSSEVANMSLMSMSPMVNMDPFVTAQFQSVMSAPPVQSSAPPAPLVQSSAPPAPLVQSSSPPAPLVQSSAPPAPLVQSSAPPAPLVQSSAPPAPLVQSSAPPALPMEPSATPGPPMESSATPGPPMEWSASTSSLVQSSSPTAPLVQSSAPPAPLVQSSALPAPLAQSSSPTAPLVQSSSPTAPLVQSSSPPVPLVQSSSPTAPLVQSSALPAPLVQSSAPPAPLVQSSALPAPPIASNAPMSSSVQSTSQLIEVSSTVQPIPTTLVVPSPSPRPRFNMSVEERDAIRRAKCHTWCIRNFFLSPLSNYVHGSWVTVPDSAVCSSQNVYSKVWECRDACVNYGNMVNCSSTCNTNCTCIRTGFSNSCNNYYTSQPAQCRTRTCSQSVCNVGCDRTNFSLSDLPSQFYPVRAPQLTETDTSNVFLLNILPLASIPLPMASLLLSSLVVKIQPLNESLTSMHYWLTSVEDPMSLTGFAGYYVNVSFAIVSYLYAPVYSPPLTVWISDKFPSQLSTFSLTIDPDTRVGYFGYLVLRLSWAKPDNIDYIQSYNVTFRLFSFGFCNLNPKSYIISQPAATGAVIMASTSTSTDGLKCGCGTGGSVQVATKPVEPGSVVPQINLPSYSCSDLASDDDLILQCTSMWNVTSSMFRYNFTWTLNYPAYVMAVLNSATVGLLTRGGRGNQGTYTPQNSVSILSSRTLYSFVRDYPPDLDSRRYYFNVQLSYKANVVNGAPALVQYCNLSSVPLPLDPVPGVILTTPLTQWSVSGQQLTFLISMNLDWTPPTGGVTSYEAWVGTQALPPNQSNGGSTPGTVVRFQVQSSNSGKRQVQPSSGSTTLSTNFTVNLDSLTTPLQMVYVQLRTISNYGIISNWSPSTNFTVALPVSLLPFGVPATSTSPSQAFLSSTPLPSSSSTMMSSTVTPLVVVPEAQSGDGIGGGLIIMIAAVVPSAALLLIGIFIVVGILCVIRSKNKVILGEQSRIGGTDGRTLQDLLCEKVSVIDDWEIDPSDIVVFLDQKLGEGAFGEVYKGTVSGPCLTKNPMLPSSVKKAMCLNVAIKVLKSTAQGKEKQDFMNEIEMMKRITSGNPHIVNMIGCVTRSEPVCLMCELVTYGSLLSYLRTHQKKGAQKLSEMSRVSVTTNGSIAKGEQSDTAAPYLEPGSEYSHLEQDADGGLGPLEENDLIAFAYQVADGMQHLASLNIVHRDLACRNILIGENKTLKITDFGLSREVEEVYEVKGKRKLPWRWMAIESLERRIFTTYSDVWSFGITLWEISTFGGFPYPSVSNDDLLKRLKSGYRMEKPENCSNEVYFIMLECWSEDVRSRPSFSHLKSKFELMLQLSATERNEPYIELSLDTDQYVYIPDGIEEDDDPNKSTFSKLALPAKTAPVEQHEMKGGACALAKDNQHGPTSRGAGFSGGNKRGIPLTRIASGNPYIESPLAADSAHDYETEL